MKAVRSVCSTFGGEKPTLVKQGHAASFFEAKGDQIDIQNSGEGVLQLLILGARSGLDCMHTDHC